MPKLVPSPPKKLDKNKVYFSADTQKAIIQYNRSTNPLERNVIFSQNIAEPFRRLAENVLNTWKFSYFDDSKENIIQEVVSFMVEKIGQYDASKGRAFSYFTIVARNYLILNNNTNYKRFRTHDEIDVLDLNRNFHSEFRVLEKNIEDKEFIEMIIEFWDNNVPIFFKKERDIKIANAIVELFRRRDTIESFNKKHLYVLVREITDCKTQQITKVINSMKKHYGDMVKQYHSEGEVATDNVHSNRFF